MVNEFCILKRDFRNIVFTGWAMMPPPPPKKKANVYLEKLELNVTQI